MLSDLKVFGYITLFVVLTALVGCGLNAMGLLYLPFRLQQETAIVRQSDGYVTAHQDMLRQFAIDYPAALPDQQAAIIVQMHVIADQIPAYVPADIARFLAVH